MVATAIDVLDGSELELASIATQGLQAMARGIAALIQRPVRIQSEKAKLGNAEIFAQLGERSVCDIHAELGDAVTGTVRIVLPIATSITLAGYLRMATDDAVLASRNARVWTAEDEEAFGEVGTVLVKALDDTLRERTRKKLQLRFTGFERFARASDIAGTANGDGAGSGGAFVCFPFECKIGDFTAESGYLLFPFPAADDLNGQPLRFGDSGPRDDLEEEIEAAPIQGALSAFLSSPDLLRVVRLSCRRIGLTLDRRPKNEVPNPAAYTDHFVMLEIGRGQEKRFDWCRRLKSVGGNVKVIIVLREPTKLSVALAFKAKADIVVGHPIRERQLSAKLGTLLGVGAA